MKIARRQALRHVVVQRDRLVELAVARSRRGSARTSPRARSSVCAGIAHDRRPHVVRAGPAVGQHALAAADASPPSRARLRRAPLCMPSNAVARRSAGRTSVPGSRGSPIRHAARTPARAARPARRAIDSCTISRRSDVQRWPAVPTAANTIARTARSRSALGRRRSSRCCRRARAASGPSRAATCGATARPIAVEPVARDERHARVVDAAARRVAAADHDLDQRRRATSPNRVAARAATAPGRRARSAASSRDGFQITGSPQTSASAAFHAQTATGKLNAVMTPTGAERVPLLHHAVAGPLGGDREAVELARQADREVADVDHLLHFAEALRHDLAGLERDQRAERLLAAARSSSPSRRTSSPRRGAGTSRQPRNASTPARSRRPRRPRWSTCAMRDHLARDRRAHLEVAAAEAATGRARGG